MNCQYYHSDLYCDITLCLAITIDLQLRSTLALCEIGPSFLWPRGFWMPLSVQMQHNPLCSLVWHPVRACGFAVFRTEKWLLIVSCHKSLNTHLCLVDVKGAPYLTSFFSIQENVLTHRGSLQKHKDNLFFYIICT